MPERVVPISPQQRRLWLLHNIHPRLPLYNGPVAHENQGELDAPALEQTIRAVISCRVALQTVSSVIDDQPVQVVVDCLGFTLPVHDLRGDPGSLRARVSQFAAAPLALERPGVFDFRLFRSADEERTLLLNLHHIVIDGRSIAVITAAIGRGYADTLASGPAEHQLAYWAEHLSGAADLLQLPLDQPCPASQRFRGELLVLALDADLAERAQQIETWHRTTDYMFLLDVISLLMHAYTGGPDVIVGTIGAEDGFSTLGRQSLLATWFTARVRQRIGVEFPLVTHYVEPTLRATARTLDDLVAGKLAPAERPADARRLSEVDR